jgi:phosphoribosylformylglycinamidine (FGAM) synthase PurS component
VFELELEGTTRKQAETLVPEIARRVLTNPIIEKFEWEILKGRG